MNIIRDEEMHGLMMIPLLVDWRIRRCNEKDCTEEPNTIITGMGPDIPAFGLCEKHFQLGNQPRGYKFHLVFDNFDAFKFNQEKRNEATTATGNETTRGITGSDSESPAGS